MSKNYDRVAPLWDGRSGLTLPRAVEQAFGTGCPCCGRTMQRGKGKRFKKTPRDFATRAHDYSVAKGGDPRQWFFACFACNSDQGYLDLVTWVRKLEYADDPRAERVRRLAEFVRGWVASVLEKAA